MAPRSGPPGSSDEDTQMLGAVEYPDDDDAPATVAIPRRSERRPKQQGLRQKEPIEVFRAKDLAECVEAI